MNKLVKSIFLFNILVLLSACFSIEDKTFSTTEFKSPDPQIFTLNNGIKVFYIQDSEVPTVSAKLYIPGGSLSFSDYNKAKLLALGDLLRLGGTKKLTPKELDKKLLKLSAGISSDVGKEFSSVSFSCLSPDFEEVFNLFTSVLTQPGFNSEKLKIWKIQQKESIKRRKDDPSTIARLVLRNAIYGFNTPFGETITEKEVNEVTRTDLLRLHRRIFVPDYAIMAIKASVPFTEVKSILNKGFNDFKPLNLDKPKLPEYKSQLKPKIYFVKKDLKQSTVYIGQPGPERLPKDYAEIEVFNSIFGTSDFASLLMQTLREKQGLVYGIYGATNYDVKVGLNIIAFQTKTKSTVKAIKESIKVLQDIQNSNFDKKHVDDAKKRINNTYVFKYDSYAKLVKREASKFMLNYPEDFDETYLNKINAVSKVDVVNVANKYFDLNKLAIVIVGNEALEKELKEIELFGLKYQEIKFEGYVK